MSDRAEFVLAALRLASVRARVLENEINFVGICLKQKRITPETAIKWAVSVGGPDMLGYMPDVLPPEVSHARASA